MLTTFLAFVGLVALLLYLINWYLHRNDDYWKKRNIPYALMGEFASILDLMLRRKFIFGIDSDYYRKLKRNKYGGVFEFSKPLLMVTDLDLIRTIAIKDFDHFVDRRDVDFGGDPVFKEMLVMLTGQKWKDMRTVLSPTFSTGKIKRMFENFNDCGQELAQCIMKLDKENDNGRKLIIQEYMSRFLIDVIAAVAFGLKTSALQNPNSEFYKNAKQLSDLTFYRLMKQFFLMFFPKLGNMLKLKVINPEVTDFFLGILKQALENREKSNEQRGDFLQLLIEAKKGELKPDETELDKFEKEAEIQGKKSKMTLTDSEAMAQSFLFFVAGLDTVGGVVNMLIYALSLQQEIQQRIFEEVKPFMDANNGRIDYESVNKLEYMDMVINETLRRYTPAPRLERKCIKEYQLPESDLIIPKGMLVTFPVEGIHMDPDIYPDPEKFDPERFSKENKEKRHPYSFLPFGIGPRNCIGMRFALIEAKVAIAHMIYNFKLEPTEKTPVPLKIDETTGINRAPKNLELKCIPRKEVNSF